MSLARELSLGRRRYGAPKMRRPFARLHIATLNPDTTLPMLMLLIEEADDFPQRRRLSEGAVYVAALRRYRLMAGTDYHRPDVTGADQ